MKKSIIISLLALSAGTSTAIAQKNITLTGTIANQPNSKIVVINQTNNSPKHSFSKEITTDAQGKFTIAIPTETALNNILIAQERNGVELLVPSKATVDVKIDFSNTTPLVINNPKANEGISISKAFSKQFGELAKNIQQVNANTLQQVEANMASQVSKANQAIDSAFNIKTAALYNQYYKTAVKYLQHTALMTLFNHQQIMSNDSIKLVVLNNILNQKTAFNDQEIYNPYYQNYITNQPLVQVFVQNILANTARNIDAQMVTDAIKVAQSTMPKHSASYSAMSLTNNASQGFQQKELIDIYNLIATSFKDENGALAKEKIYDLTKFDIGSKAIDFTFTTRDGVKTKLSDYKGKVVYLDFWASWCGPCRQQMPAAKELKKYYEGKDVVFLYVSIDKDTASWENGINAMSIEGVHTLSPTWSGEIAQKYNISSIPAYFLIDKKGNFAARPARPSQKEEVIKQIDALLAL